MPRCGARTLFVVVFLASSLGAGAARAQVNIEQVRSDLRIAPAQASIEASFTGTTGNVRSVVAGAAAFGAARRGKHGFFGSTQFDYARFDSVTTVSKSFIHLRYDYRLLSWLSPEAFVQQQQDKFQRLQLRELVGVGPRFVLVDEEEVHVACGTSYMYEYERISVAAGAHDEPQTVARRWNNYATATWRADARIRFIGTIYVQPRFDALDDVRVLLESALVTDISKRFSIKVLASIRYDSAPPTLVKTTDAEVKNALVLKF